MNSWLPHYNIRFAQMVSLGWLPRMELRLATQQMKTNHALAPLAIALFFPRPGESNRTDDLGQVTMLLHNWLQHSDDFGQVTMLLHNWSLKHNQSLPSHLPYFSNNCKLQLYRPSWPRKKLMKTSPMVQENPKTFTFFENSFWILILKW